MRVLFISHEASMTGAPLVLLQSLQYLHSHCEDIEPELLIMRDGPLHDAFSCICKVRVSSMSPIQRIKRAFFARCLKRKVTPDYTRYYHRGQFDCVYANTFGMAQVANQFKRRWGIPVILHVHEAECLTHQSKMDAEELTLVDRFICVSELSKHNLTDNYGIPSEKICVQYPLSYWGHQLLEGKLSVKPESINKENVTVGMLCSNETWYKSTFLLPLLLRQYYHKYPDSPCRFMLVGALDGPTRYKLDYDLRKSGVADKIEITGEVSKPLDYHRLFDIYLLFSREDSFSLSAQEAAFMHTPVVGFDDATGACEWITKGGGILVPYMDIDALCDALHRLSSDTRLREQTGNRAHEIICELYEEESKIPQVVSSIRLVCGKQEAFCP